MTLTLDRVKPKIGVKTYDSKMVHFGNYEVPIEDFLSAVEYVLANTDLEPEDPRLQFIEDMKSMKIVDGWNAGNKRLEPELDY